MTRPQRKGRTLSLRAILWLVLLASVALVLVLVAVAPGL